MPCIEQDLKEIQDAYFREPGGDLNKLQEVLFPNEYSEGIFKLSKNIDQ